VCVCSIYIMYSIRPKAEYKKSFGQKSFKNRGKTKKNVKNERVTRWSYTRFGKILHLTV